MLFCRPRGKGFGSGLSSTLLFFGTPDFERSYRQISSSQSAGIFSLAISFPRLQPRPSTSSCSADPPLAAPAVRLGVFHLELNRRSTDAAKALTPRFHFLFLSLET